MKFSFPIQINALWPLPMIFSHISERFRWKSKFFREFVSAVLIRPAHEHPAIPIFDAHHKNEHHDSRCLIWLDDEILCQTIIRVVCLKDISINYIKKPFCLTFGHFFLSGFQSLEVELSLTILGCPLGTIGSSFETQVAKKFKGTILS